MSHTVTIVTHMQGQELPAKNLITIYTDYF